jgi:glycosyltransferase involved in cell wall biosynthesis
LKLLFTQDALVNAGAEKSHLEILSRFSKEVEVVFVYFYPKHELKEEYEKAGIRLIFLDIPEYYHFPLAINRLVQLIRKEKPDLLISALWRADIITRIASLITGVPLVGTLVNDSYAPIAWKDKQGLKYKLVYWLDRLTAGIPIHWIANANALAESHVTTLGLRRERISVVYRGRRVPSVIASAAKQSVDDLLDKSGFGIRVPIAIGRGLENESPNSYRGENEGLERMDDEGLGKRDLGEGRKENESLNSYRGENESSQAEVDKDTDCRVVPPRNDDYRFLSYGRLLERKGFQDAIQAFATVIQTHPNCTLTIYGEGPYRASLESLINRLGLEEKVKLPGTFNSGLNTKQIATSSLGTPRNDDTSPIAIGAPNPQSPNLQSPNLSSLNLLLSSNCFLFPSWYEGFSGALVEAMMAGIPIIASDIPMNLEAITDQVNGLTFPVGKPEKLAEQMRFAIEHPKKLDEFGAAARKEAKERFDIEKIATEYEEILRICVLRNLAVERDR